MQVSPKYKRFKRINFTGNTFTLPMVRSSIIRNLQGYIQYPDMANLRRLGKQTQFVEIDTPKTDRTLSVSDRAFWSLLHLIIEMEEYFLVYYSYERKYHKLTSIFIPGYRCSNVYINVEKGTLINKDIQ